MSGLEYYKSGYYSRSDDVIFHDNSDLVDHFDWRDRHSSNVEDTHYYGGENGWMTKTRNQNLFIDCPDLCWLNAAAGQVESVTNLYYNQQVDIVLSIEQLIECGVLGCGLGYPFQALNAIITNGAYDQVSYQDNNQLDDCWEPTNYLHKIFITGYEDVYDESPSLPMQERVDLLKVALITKGATSHSHSNYMGTSVGHSLINLGFGIINFNDILFDEEGEVRDVSDHIGELYWVYKNSWGEGWGQNGYMYHLSTEYTPTASSLFIETPIIDTKDTKLERDIIDNDNDGYSNWGIGGTPSGENQTNLDSDDSNPRIGPYDDNYFGKIVKPKIKLERVIDNSPNDLISDKSFYTFYDENVNNNGGTINLRFILGNTGNAQLNLIKKSLYEGKISLEPANGGYFSILENNYPSHTIGKETQTDFEIQFTLPAGEESPKIVKVIIELDEPDMDNFEFHLVFSECDAILQDEVITKDETWDVDDVLIKFSDVIVKNGATLTIKGEVAFGINCALIVETGAKVLIDGGHLTSLCGTLWPGVDVWGNDALDQYTLNNQGYIYMFNGGTISYAVKGIETIKYERGLPIGGTTGGIVKVNNGEFYNCTNGVLLLPYTHIHPYGGGIVNNMSYFQNALFYNNQEVMPNDQLHLGANEMYTTGGVDGIRIDGCSFINENIPFSGESFGIKSVNSSFSVYNFTNEEDEEIRTTFKGHNYGVHTKNDGRYLSSTTIIKSAYFDNNETGIYISAIENPKILQNDFLIKSKFGKFIGDVACGLYLDEGTTGFMIEENNFFTELSGSDAITEINNGITVNNTGEDANEIYNNYFETLTTGITSAGTNRDDVSDIGLCIICNDFANVRSDIYVTKVANDETPAGGKQGIALNQGELAPNPLPGELGDPTYNASNIFSEEYNDYTIYNFSIDDESCSPIIYTYQGIVSSNNTFKVNPSQYLHLITILTLILIQILNTEARRIVARLI